MLEKQDLFEARTYGYKTYRIPGLAVTDNNTVIVTTEARPGKGGDYDYNNILMRRSTDGGRSFGAMGTLVNHKQYGEGPASNFVMIPDRDTTDRIVALFCHDYARVFLMESNDEGETFSEPVDITPILEQFRNEYPWQVCALGPGHGLQLTNGRMIVPVWLSDSSGSTMQGKRGHRPSVVTLIYSDDHGQTWQTGEIICRNGDVVEGTEVVNPSETVAAELPDGRVLFNIRSESEAEKRLLTTSPDGVTQWQPPRFAPELLEPVCHGSMIRHSSGVLVFANPANLENDMVPPGKNLRHDRKRLTVRLSYDDGATWTEGQILEGGPAGYSDLAELSDGTLLCLYECDIVERMADDRYLRLAHFDLNWIETGEAHN